jgi:hypothetical protein
MDVKTVQVEGHVDSQIVSPGSKSERSAVMLTTPSGETYILRRQGGPAFVDSALEPLIGHSIKAEGLATSGTLIMKSWEKTD